MCQLVGDGPAAHGGGINLETETAVDFGGGAAIRRGRFGGEQFAQERLDASGPVRRVIAARSARRPERCRRVGGGVEIIGVELVEAGAAEAEFFGGDGGGDFVATESGEEFADQWSAETVSELSIMFFKAARMRVRREVGERGLPAPAGLPSASAPLRPPPGPQGRECSPLLARLSGFARTLSTFARNATANSASAAFFVPAASDAKVKRSRPHGK